MLLQLPEVLVGAELAGLVQDAGSMEATLGILKGIGEDAGIDWSELGMDD